jgi:thiaminase/transcriptional activator TenA
MKKWSEQAWAAALPVYESITEMPFVRELAEGVLSREKFMFYISQDDVYLHHYGQVLAMIAARVPSSAEALDFLEFAGVALIAEREMHAMFDVEKAACAEPACHHYISFLKSTGLGPVEIALAAVLPCFWIYKEVGGHIHARSANNNPYQAWIDTYVGEEFDRQVARAIALCDAAAERATPEIRKAMTEAFVTASRLEFDFWDAAYRLRKW